MYFPAIIINRYYYYKISIKTKLKDEVEMAGSRSTQTCLYRKPSHAFAMFAHKKFYGCAGYVDDPLPNIVYMATRMPACIVWLYYTCICIQLYCVVPIFSA